MRNGTEQDPIRFIFIDAVFTGANQYIYIYIYLYINNFRFKQSPQKYPKFKTFVKQYAWGEYTAIN